jgi:hypothetical protein
MQNILQSRLERRFTLPNVDANPAKSRALACVFSRESQYLRGSAHMTGRLLVNHKKCIQHRISNLVGARRYTSAKQGGRMSYACQQERQESRLSDNPCLRKQAGKSEVQYVARCHV